ncbi:MAG: aspartate aminotransferase family protein [Anaerolineae bacterium]|jgi:acetylornithine/N-succinyldiaminopimelate aminotransferase|nr:aspartate aminotransferase family protein [Chloroflexota bacterium]
MVDAQQIKDLDAKYIVHTYGRSAFVLERGEGCYLYDTEGKRYLDFTTGIAVSALGYGYPAIVQAISEQAAKLSHVSNLFHTIPQAQLAQLLVQSSFADKVFFCNSGAESVEAAIKFARKWAKKNGGDNRTEFISMSNAFHGRTMGSLAITPRAAYQEPFMPLMPGARLATFNDLDSVKALLDERVCAVILEPMQGEGGIHAATPEFARGLREACDANGSLLIFDEVQCGLGRTGTLWAHEATGVTPDIMTLAKPLGGGLPMGATLMTEAVASSIVPGDHGSTFAGNPIVAAAAQVFFKTITAPGFLEQVRKMAGYLETALLGLKSKHAAIKDVRGRGMIWGIECNAPVAPVMAAAAEQGLLVLNAGANVVRLLPPLIINQAHVDEAVAAMDKAFGAL